MAENADAYANDGFDRPAGNAAWRRRSARDIAGCVALAVAIAVAAMAVVSQASRTPTELLRITSGSMRPTLAIGQVVHVDPSVYASAEPRIGDIVAFRAPVGATAETPACGVPEVAGAVCAQSTTAESDQIFVKRVVAGPGDMIAVLGGSVLRNGVLDSEPVIAPCQGATCNFPVSVKVPTGEWFLMGDDRVASDDSRYWGPVPGSWIVGKVIR